MPMVLETDDIAYIMFMDCFFGGLTFYLVPVFDRWVTLAAKSIKAGFLSATVSQILGIVIAALGYGIFRTLVALLITFKAVLLLVYFLGPIGLIGWVILLVKERKVFMGPWTIPRLFLQDLLTLILMYGISLLSVGWLDFPISKNVAIVVPYLLSVSLVGVLIFSNYCKAIQGSDDFKITRMLFEIFILALAIFPGFIFVMIFSWFLWRRVLTDALRTDHKR